MAFKLVVFFCLMALSRGSVAPAAIATSPVAYTAPIAARLEEFDPSPQYQFRYDVADSLTGDYKSQQEQRNGDLVQGSYSLVEPDGTRRTVDYAADPINGFNAVVRKEPLLAAAPAVVDEPAVVPARYAAAPVVAPVVAQPALAPARYAVATPVVSAPLYATTVARYAASPVAAAAVAPAPVTTPYLARYAAAPVVATSYATPVAAAYRAAYTAPVTAYTAPVAAAYAQYAAAPIAAYTAAVPAGPARLAAPARLAVASAPVTTLAAAAPAKITDSVAAGYRYP